MPDEPIIPDHEPEPEPVPGSSFVTRDELRDTVADAMRRMRKVVKRSRPADSAPTPAPAPVPSPAPSIDAPRGSVVDLFRHKAPKKGA